MASASKPDLALRRRVLALVRACRPDVVARRPRASASFTQLSSACRSLAATLTSAQSSPSRRVAEEEDRAVWTALEQLDALVTRTDSAATLGLPLVLAQSLTAGLRLPRASRKRSRSTSPRQSEEASSAAFKPTLWATPIPTKHSHALGGLILALVLHDAALVRLDALVVAIEGDISGFCDSIREVLATDPTELPSSWRRILIPEDDARREERRGQCDSHTVAECIVKQLASVAFSNAIGDAKEEDKRHRQARAAVSVLDALCCLSPTLPLAQQTPVLRVVIDALPINHRTTHKSSGRASSESTAFACGVLSAWLCQEATEAERGVQVSSCDNVIASVLHALPPPPVIQVVRRFLTLDADPSAALRPDGLSSRSLSGAVFQLVQRYSSTDIEFARLALSLAHDLAEDGVLHGKPWLLGHALELVATVSTTPLAGSNCYKDWFQAHFGSDNTENPDQATTSPDTVCCIRSSTSGVPGSCRLIHGKTHLQLVCLFLLEFDRRETRQGIDAPDSTVNRVVWTSAHVMAHLSVLKGFQSQQTAEKALVMDFCAEARVCYTTLLTREQSGGEASRSTTKRRSEFSSEARAVMEENVAYYKQHRSLSPQLKQWKTFQYLKWKSDVLPCCLDVEIGENSTASGDQSGVEDQIHFVFALARANMVPAGDYTRFLAKIQDWVDHTRLSIAQDMQHKRQRDVVSSLRCSTKRLQGLCHRGTIVAGRSRKQLVSECLASISDGVFAYLDARSGLAEAGNTADDQSRMDRMLLVWQSAFVEVLNAVGSHGLDEFFAFQTALLVKFVKASATWTSTDSNRYSFLEDVSSIAIAHRPSLDAGVNFKLRIEWIACFAGVVASMLVTSGHQSMVVMPADVLGEFSAIESSTQAHKWPKRQLIVDKALLSTCLLRAVAQHHTENCQVIFTACIKSFSAQVVDFWAWLTFRVWRESGWMPTTDCEATNRDATDWVQDGQCVLLQTQWLQVFQSRLSSVETATNMLRFEFVCDSALTRGAEKTTVSTLQRHLEIVNTATPSQPLLIWCNWLIDETVKLASLQPQDADGNTSRSEGLQAAVVLLNDLVHRSQHSIGESNDIRRELMSQWLGLVAQTLSAIDAGLRHTVYQVSADILSVLRDKGTSRLPELQPVDDHRLMELMRVTAVDLGQPQTSETARRCLLRPLLELASQQQAQGSSAESVTDLPIALLVEWGRLSAYSSKERQAETYNRQFFAVIDWVHGALTAMMAPASDNPLSTSGSSPLPSGVFRTPSQALQFLVQATRFVSESGSSARAGGVDANDGQPEGSARVRRMADVALSGCSSPQRGVCSTDNSVKTDEEELASLVPWLFTQWSNHATRPQPTGNCLLFQLFVLQLASTLCAQSSTASKTLIELQTDNEGLRAVFVVLLASVASNSSQLKSIMARHTALWVNSFPEVALVAISQSSSASKTTQSRAPVFEEMLGGTTAFRVRAGALVEEVLAYGIDRHVHMLSISLKPCVVAQWPHLEALMSRLSAPGLDVNMTT